MASFDPIATTLLVRERAGLVVYAGPPSITPEDGTLPCVSPIEVPTITGASVRLPPLYSPDGQYLALVKETITLHSPTGELVSEILCSDASSIVFSPRSSFVLTWSKPLAAGKEGSAPEGNLKVWESSSGRLVTSFFQKSFKRDAVQFTADERFYCRAVNNEVHILNAADFTAGIITKVYHKGVTQFKISPVALPDSATSSSSSYVVVVFNAEVCCSRPYYHLTLTRAHTNICLTPILTFDCTSTSCSTRRLAGHPVQVLAWTRGRGRSCFLQVRPPHPGSYS